MEQRLTAQQSVAIGVIFKGRRAWSSGRWLERRNVSIETLEELQALGWIERWTPPNGRDVAVAEQWMTPNETVWTFTPWGARMLGSNGISLVNHDDGAIIIEVGEGELPRWGEPGDEKPYVKPARWGMELYNLDLPEKVPDPRPGPTYLLDGDEPVVLLGSLITIDNRLKRKRSTKPSRRDKPRRKSSLA